MQPNLKEDPPGKWFCPACTGDPQGHCLDPELDAEYDANEESMLPEYIANGFRESSVASSSIMPINTHKPGVRRRKKKNASAPETFADVEAGKAPSLRTRVGVDSSSPQKTFRKRAADSRSPSVIPKAKRSRIRASLPQLQPHSRPQTQTKRVVLKISTKGKAREESPEEEEPQDIFEDILDEADRNTARTTISASDKIRFENSRKQAEVCPLALFHHSFLIASPAESSSTIFNVTC